MAAYGAAVSLKNTIQSILQSSRISLVPPSPQIIQSAYDAMYCLQKILLKLEHTGFSKIRTEVNALDERIKEVVWGFEDLLESCFTNQILPQLEISSGGERDRSSFLVDMQSLQQGVDCFIESVTAMEADYDNELLNMPEEEGEPLASRIDFGGINSNMVGLSLDFERVRDYLLRQGEGEGEDEGEEDEDGDEDDVDEDVDVDEDEDEDEGNCLLVTGMAGVGKTTLVKRVFDDPSIQRHFKVRAWVKVGRKWESNETLRCILAQVDPNTCDQMLTKRDDDDDDVEKLVGLLKERLKDKKCLIVLDDVWEWDTRLMDSLRKKNVQILLTSRLRIQDSPTHVVRLLNDEESKKLLGEKVFGEKGFPPYLEELGEKIAKKCEGLPLMIVTVAELLTKANKSTREELNKSIKEYWTEVAEKQHSSVFEDAYNQISEVFFPSYDYLPQVYKMFFLYFGAYPPYSNIELRSLVPCTSAEGFFERIVKQTMEEFKDVHTVHVLMSAEQTYEERFVGDQYMEVYLFVNAFIFLLAQSYNLFLFNSDGLSWFSDKDLRVHSCWQHLCRKEASKIKFLHVLQSCDEVVKDQRRLCVHFNTLFAIKEVYDAIKSDCPSNVRSLLCYGPVHPYPVPILAMNFKLLRVLNASTIRFYHIPLEILKLVCLKYLALTCNKELPVSISNLLQLQFLIIYQYVHIIKCGVLPYMPMEIWDMQNLQYIEVEGRDLLTPDSNSNAILDRVYFISGVGIKSCTREILKRIPNLRYLAILRTRKPYDEDDDSNSLSGLANISEELQNLTSLQYDVQLPDMKLEAMIPLSMFPSSLEVLTLGGLGYPWQYMNDIGSMLPNLTTIKLEHYAFRGPKWDIESRCFLKLKTLTIEDTDLVQWRAQHGSLPRLELLSLQYCYKLKHLDWMRDSSMVTPTVELVDCNPLVYASAAKLPESLFAFRFHRSWLTGK